MDLALYEPTDPSELRGGVLSSAADHLREAQGQAAAWLRKVVLTIVPASAAPAGMMKDRRD
jgi:hypothetical protein